MRRLGFLAVALISVPRAGAQEAPSHLPLCVADSAAAHLEARLRYLLAAPDSATRHRLGAQGLSAAPEDSVRLVTEERVCTLASVAYASATDSPGVTPPFPVAVVRAPGRYLVQLVGRPGVVVLDRNFQPLGRWTPAATPPDRR